MLNCGSEPLNYQLRASSSQKMGDQRKKSLTSTGIEPTTSGFDHGFGHGFNSYRDRQYFFPVHSC